MTISSETNRVQFAGSGTTGPFTISDLEIQSNDQVAVTHTDAAGTNTSYVLTTDYTINTDLTELTTVVVVASGETLTVVIDVPITQGIDYKNTGTFDAEVNEDGLDKLTLINKQQTEQLARSIKLQVNSTNTDVTIEDGVVDKGVKFDASGNLVVTTNDVESTAIAAAASAAAAATSETNAATSETNAATSETNAATSETNAASAASAVATPWTFDTSTTMADPGTGDIRFNNATLASVTQIAVSANSSDTGNPDISDFVITWDDSTNATDKGKLVIKKKGTPATFVVFTINSTITDNTTWLQIPVTYVVGSGTFSAADGTYAQFTSKGDNGTINNVVEDTTPQLGGQLDVNGNAIGDGTLELLTFTEDASAVNHVNIENEATGSGPIISSAGDDANVDLNIDTKGTGSLNLGSADTTVIAIKSTMTVTDEIQHEGDTDNKIGFTTDTQTFTTGASTRMDITDSGVQLGGANARVTTVLDEDTMSSDSATALATQQSIKAYVDTSIGTNSDVVLISTATLSSSATVSFTGLSSTYTQYMLVFDDLVVQTDNVELWMRTSTNNGSSYDSGASDYGWTYTSSFAIAVIGSNVADSEITLFTAIGNAATEKSDGVVFLHNPAGTAFTNCRWDFAGAITDGTVRSVRGIGTRYASADVDAIQFLASSGNLTSGTIRLYGIRAA